MTKRQMTVIQIEITHDKPLTSKVPLTDIAAQRIYGVLCADGSKVDVKATLLLPVHRDAGQV